MLRGPAIRRSAKGEEGAVQDPVGVVGLLRVPYCLAELRWSAASNATVSFTYLQAVVVPTPNPAGTAANVVRSAAWLQYEFLEESSPLIGDLIWPFG